MTRGFVDYWESVVDSNSAGPQQHLAEILVNMRKIVFSRTETDIKGRNVAVENRGLVTTVQTLKKEPGKDILVYGGVDFVSSLISHDLIDEYYTFVNPVALGAGHSIFKERKILKLESSTAFANGKVLNKYLPA
jgi:dihydrofolate reductase